MNIARISGWVASVAAAVAVALWSYAIANEVRAPAKTAALNLPLTQGYGTGLALNSLARRQAQNPDIQVSAAEYRLARSAYRSEPLSVSALGIMGIGKLQKGQRNKGFAILDAASRLSRRSSLVSNELIKAAAQRNDSSTFFAWLSRAMLTDPKARDIYLTAMADGTAQDRSVRALIPIIGPNPAWAEYYWPAVAQRPKSLRNAARIRMAIVRKPWRQTELLPNDQQLVMGLVQNGEFEVARQLAGTLRSRGRDRGQSDTANLLSDGSFATAPVFAPFDWELSSSGSLGASIDAGSGKLLVSAIPGAYGFAIRQLLPLDAGDYDLSWTMSSDQPIAKGVLTAQISCAEKGSQLVPLAVNVAAGKRREPLSIPRSDCRWYWFAINATVPDDLIGIDAQISRLVLRPAAKRSSVPPTAGGIAYDSPRDSL